MEQRENQTNQSDSFDSDAAWDFLSDLIDEFCTQWESAPPEPKFELFANRLEQIDNAAFRRIALIELVKVDFELRSKDAFSWHDLAWYLERWPELGAVSSPPAELVNEARRLAPNSHRVNPQPSLLRDFEPDATYTASVFRSREVHQFEPGESIDDFDLLARLGRGAFATVFLARQVSMQRLVALKISADEGLEGPTLAKLSHPHIVRVFDQRVVPDRSLRLMYMEYVSGGSLDDVIRQSHRENKSIDAVMFLDTLDQRLADAGNSPPVESPNREWLRRANWSKAVARIGAQLANAIQYTHCQGVLHRDIKPANVLVDQHGYPKLVDFNISYGDDVIGATAASCFGGSLAYMPPEQLEAFHPLNEKTAAEVDASCDVFALGVTLHELLTGERPFTQTGNGDPLSQIDGMIEQRKKGLTDQQMEALCEKDHLLGGAIAGSLKPDPNARPDVASLYQRLQWAADEQVSNYLKPANSSWSNWNAWACKYPWPFIFSIVFGVSLFVTWFIIAYNVTESVPSHQELFLETRQMINRVLFPLAFVFLIGLFFRTRRLLRGEEEAHSNELFAQAIKSNLNFGNAAALMCISIWTVAGLLHPIALTARGAKLPTRAWADFSISHLLAGLICGAFVFFGVTMISVVAWHPRLVIAAMKQGAFVKVDESVREIRTRLYFYRVLAIGAPLVAIATLVNFRTSNTFAVSCLSIGAIVGLLAMAHAIRKIGEALDLLERC